MEQDLTGTTANSEFSMNRKKLLLIELNEVPYRVFEATGVNGPSPMSRVCYPQAINT